MLPQFDKKYEPSVKLTNRRQFGRLPSQPAPKTVLFNTQGSFVKQILEEMPHRQCDGCFSKLYFLTNHPSVAIGNFGSGASTVASKMEELISWGVQQFIALGTAGSLQSKANIGDLIVCEKAIRDEKTSQHYLPHTKYIHAPRRMTNKLLNLLKKLELPHHIGSTWTTDGPFLQSSEEMDLYKKEGVLTVETEAAVLFAVAHYYQVDLGAMFTISDTHVDQLSQPNPEDPRLFQGLRNLLKIALAASVE